MTDKPEFTPKIKDMLDEAYERWLESRSVELAPVIYDEHIVACPRVTHELLTANHAAGLPLMREQIVRCKDCEYYEPDYTDGAMFDATVCWAWDNGHDYPSATSPDGFCHRAKPREGLG